MPRLDNIKSKVKKEFSLTEIQWKEAISDYEFENARSSLDEETAENLTAICKAIAERDSNKSSPANNPELVDLHHRIEVTQLAMMSHKQEMSKIPNLIQWACFTRDHIKGLIGRADNLERILKDTNDRIAGLESQLKERDSLIQELKAQIQEVRVTPQDLPKTSFRTLEDDPFKEFGSMFDASVS